MKTLSNIAPSLILAVAAGAKTEPVAGRLQPEHGGTFGKFNIGAALRTVIELAGLPDQRVGDGVWIYYNCAAKSDDPQTKGLDALVVLFKKAALSR